MPLASDAELGVKKEKLKKDEIIQLLAEKIVTNKMYMNGGMKWYFDRVIDGLMVVEDSKRLAESIISQWRGIDADDDDINIITEFKHLSNECRRLLSP